jgi:hypothetical protein
VPAGFKQAVAAERLSRVFQLNPQVYGPVIAELFEPRVATLGPGQLDQRLAERLQSMAAVDLFAHAPVADEAMAAACLAGLWLHADGLDESHTISQTIESTTGSFWHGIMHRREGDFGNSKYWFRRVGRHPVFEPLADGSRELARQSTCAEAAALASQSSWNPNRWIDLCELAQRSGRDSQTVDHSALVAFCRSVQALEWGLLFDYSYRQAID